MRGLVLVCDHASNNVPPEIGSLGLSEEDMRRHIAWDVGARGVTLGLARRLGAEAVLSTWSRLVIDPNRGEDDPTLVMKLYDGSLIPGNRQVGQAEIARRLDVYHRPYHRAVDGALDRVIAEGRAPALVAIHSFTPQFRGRALRPWHVGLLWDRDDRLLGPLLAQLRAEPDLCVGDNEPYSGQLLRRLHACARHHARHPARPDRDPQRPDRDRRRPGGLGRAAGAHAARGGAACDRPARAHIGP